MKLFLCQSCGFNFTKSCSGYDQDGILSEEYCIKCFKNGKFVETSLSLHQLEVKIMHMAKINNEITLQEAQQIIDKLPQLKRWKMNWL